MFKTLDRYLIREMVLPFALGLVVLTFLLQVPPFLQQSEALVAGGVPWSTILHALYMLLPQALSITIPMAVLLGILVGFGRLAADREFVAMQACGISLVRLLRPVILVAAIGTAATAYEIIVALPAANLTFREIASNVVESQLENNIKPQVFFQNFPDHVIYVRDLLPGGGWRDVFVAATEGAETRVYFAREGRVALDKEKRLVQLQLTHGTSYTTSLAKGDEADSTAFETLTLSLDPAAIFPPPPTKGAPEMTLAELRADIAAQAARGEPAYIDRFMVQEKFALPITCPILALIGLALGTSNRKDGKLASFVLGFGVILVYYILLYGARAFATGGRLAPEWAPWIPNIVMALAGVAMVAWRSRAADQPIRFSIPAFWRRSDGLEPAAAAAAASTALDSPAPAPLARRIIVVVRLPHLNIPRPRLLDFYVAREYLRVLALAVVSLLGIFYISTFIDLVDKLFRGQTTTTMLVRYFYFQTPQFIYFVIPMAVLVSALVTIGVMTKNSELMVMRACGISLYRTAAPLFVFALCASAVLFGLQEKVLASANREADRLNRQIRSWAPLLSPTARRWVGGANGDIYHYDVFDPVSTRFARLWVYQVDESAWRLKNIAYADQVVFKPAREGSGQGTWTARSGWVRQFGLTKKSGSEHVSVNFEAFSERALPIAPPAYFINDVPDPEQMTYAELQHYIVKLRATGANETPSVVALQKKLAFPLVTVIMTLIAVPFAVTTGRRGALYGIGAGIVIAISYWMLLSVFAAFGVGGRLDPMLAAWAPNILFGAAAVYLIFTVRT
jgi:LPS export ABC transporter permease LptG/LPS export ABC transporter permease LptF